MLLMANHEQNKIKTKTQIIVIEKGSFHTEIRSLMDRWGWSNSKVNNFIRFLVSQLMISITVQKSAAGKATEGTTITVLNYCIYQGQQITESDAEKDTKETQKRRRQDAEATKQEPKNNKNKRKEYIPASGYDYFSDFWEAYPRKVAKADAVKAFAKLKMTAELMKVVMVGLYRAIDSEAWQRDGGKYIPYPASWLNGKRWEDECYQPPPESKGGDKIPWASREQ